MPPQTRQIIIVDGDPAAMAGLAQILHGLDPSAECRRCCDGDALNSELCVEVPDLIFLDVLLPRLDIGALIAWLNQERTTSTKLILTSDILSERWPALASHVGAYDVLLKPFNAESIEQLLNSCAEASTEKSLLLLDPSPAARSVVRRIVSQSQFKISVVEAEEARHAIRHCRTQAFDFALVDWQVKDMPPLESACQMIAASAQPLNVIMMGRTLDAAQQRGLRNLGISGYLTKPFNAVDLDSAIYNALGLWRPYLVNALGAENAEAPRSPS